jgi:hypothetical protein
MNHGRYAVGDDDHALLAGLVFEAASEVEALLGPVLGLVLGGSLARGEGTVWRGIGDPVALSDIDLAAILPDAGARDRAAGLAQAAKAGIARRLLARGLSGGFDLGVYAPEDLAKQGPRPGTLEYRRSGRVLVGPEGLTAGFPALEEGDVPPEEALVLLENRGAELLLAWPGPLGTEAGPEESRRALAAMYAGMKTVLDGAFALLVQSGSCPASGQARQAALESWTTVEGRSETLRAVLPDFLSDVKFWGAMKLAPDPVAIARRLGVSDPADTVALGRRAWREGARAWTGCYRIVASRQFGVPGILQVHELALHAAHRARPRRRLRRWLEATRAHEALERAGRARWALRPGAARLGLALQGAPEHELAACVALLIGAWTDPAETPDFRPAVARLFPGEAPDRLDWDRCRRAAVLLWDTMESGGARTAWDVPDPAADARVHAEDS